MGVSGLWTVSINPAPDILNHRLTAFRGNAQVLNKAGMTRSLFNLAIVEIRTLFSRLCRLSKMPFSVLFVFDGRSRPHVKRGSSRMGKSGSHNLAKDFKQLIKLFGMDWREAKGEAEAQLAWLNRQGIIGAIISDDVSAWSSKTRLSVSTKLTGNKSNPALNANGKPSEHHANVYTSDAIENHPEVGLTHGGMVLIALVSGGDYDSGIRGAGPDAGHALARLGYGDQLLAACDNFSPEEFQAWLPQWRDRMTRELQTNENGLLPRRHLSLTIRNTFPPMDSLKKYARPAVFENQTRQINDRRGIDLPALAAFCEAHFTEWGHASGILKRFHNLVYEGVIMAVFKASANEADKREREREIAAGRRPCDVRLVGTPAALVKRCAAPPRKRSSDKDAQMEAIAAAFVNRGTPGPEERPDEALDLRAGGVRDERDRLVVAVHGTRKHTSTDQLLEYRVEVSVKQLVDFVESRIKGKHSEAGARPGSSHAGGKGKEKRRSRRYEDTGSEDEGDQHQELLDGLVEGSEDGTDGGGGIGRAKGEGDPRANMRIWVPASIIRHVHTELIAEYENQQVAKKTKSSTKRKSAGKGKARRKGNTLEDDVVRGNPYASFVPPSDNFEIDLGKEVSSSLPLRGKCGFVFTWPDPDNPDELIVDTEARDDLWTMVDYAEIERTGMLVYREGDGIFATFAGPSARLAARPSQTRARRKAQGAAVGQEKLAEPAKRRSGKGKERAEPSHKRLTGHSVAHERDEEGSDHSDAGWSLYTDYRKQSQESHDSTRASSRGVKADKGAVRASSSQLSAAVRALEKGKSRLGARESDDEEAIPSRPTKRRKTSLAFSVLVDPDGLRDSSEEPELPRRPPRRHSPALTDILEVENLIAFSKSPSPAYILPWSLVQGPPPSSSPAPIPSSSQTAPTAQRKSLPFDDEVIEISSDSDDGKLATGGSLSDDDLEWWQRPPFNNQPSLHSQRRA
ncbi:hypothetical protein PYCCODRAFT_1455090 [Trametes coccinea BRFM310]|uniref:XPG-I domain-containing protein n=1 Tax=Trametes coccinea (strain BRFM310) TaxID=1353009 RepID=A0A1Y2I8N4_TRAC3|nr:hypothetical protein PYCCODRAFT_1455090 [Trametes coccinea BRFM310]